MELIKIDNYEDVLFKKIESYRSVINKIISKLDLIILTFIKVWEMIFFSIVTLFTYTQKIFRYSTFPIHWIWIKLYLRRERAASLTDLRIFEMGGHYIYGKPGAGKSTMIYHAMMDYAYHTGKSSLTTHYMEMTRTNIFGFEYYHHQYFEPSEFFQDGQQVQAFDTRLFNVVVYEEMLSKYHQRNNKKSSHNDEVLPLVASMGGQRHQGIDLFYFISQLPTNDISLMQILRGYHIPKIKKVFDYRLWLNTGKFKFKIAGWWVESYHITPVGRSDYKLTNQFKWFYPCEHYEDMKYFNRLNLKENYSSLPLHKGSVMKA